MRSVQSAVVKIIIEIAESMQYGGPILNERYLHHFFSHRLQEWKALMDLTGDPRCLTLRPEWPTYKKGTGLYYRRYRRGEDGKYRPDPSGRAGFIDFAIGRYEKPEIGVEFTLNRFAPLGANQYLAVNSVR